MNPANLLKIKLRGEEVRAVYELVRTEEQMQVIVVGIRDDEEVYKTAYQRRVKHGI